LLGRGDPGITVREGPFSFARIVPSHPTNCSTPSLLSVCQPQHLYPSAPHSKDPQREPERRTCWKDPSLPHRRYRRFSLPRPTWSALDNSVLTCLLACQRDALSFCEWRRSDATTALSSGPPLLAHRLDHRSDDATLLVLASTPQARRKIRRRSSAHRFDVRLSRKPVMSTKEEATEYPEGG